MDKQERYYNIFKLNRVFAISSILFLILLIWTFADDYDRTWKTHQSEFRQIEIAFNDSLLKLEESRILESEEYKIALATLKSTEESLAEKDEDLKRLQNELSSHEEDKFATSMEYNAVKAEYDVAKYLHEEAVAKGHGDPEETGSNLEQLEASLLQHRLRLEETERNFKEVEDQINFLEADKSTAQNEVSRIERKADILKLKLQKVDPEGMTFGNRLGNAVRDLPVLDFLAPYYKIDQIVIKDITEDLNFANVPKVDRCTTCHMGIATSGYENAAQPYTTHPDLELYLSSASPHPMESFGCTSCHSGRGRGTDFTYAAHSPRNEEQAKEWEEKYGWHELHYWDTPMFPIQYTEAGCFKCHNQEIYLKGADKLNLGINLIERSGCFGCHAIERYKEKRRIGPDLSKLASKVSKDWAYQWIRNPKMFRHNSWMPKFFGQENNSSEADIARTNQEIHTIVHYLFKNSKDFSLSSVPRWGNVNRGEDFVTSLGCFGCHRIENETTEEATSLQSLRREQGPNLIGVGAKTSREWVYNWLKQPDRYSKETKMPNLRLSDQEAADISTYLMTLDDNGFKGQDSPLQDDRELDKIVLNFLLQMNSDYDSRQILSGMDSESKMDFTGEKLIRFYGCFGCHNISGFEDEKPIGTELTEEGIKPIDKLDFGLLELKHSRQAWFTQKLLYPRSFDKDKVKTEYEKLRMPNFEFDEAEVEALTTALLGFVKASYGVKPERSVNPIVHEGQWLVRKFNCQGCHFIEGDGGAIRPTITDWLEKTNSINRTTAEEVTADFSPPDLNSQGSKTQPDWLFEFFKKPFTIRPSLKVRMPTFSLTDNEWNSIIKYFQFLEGEELAYESPHLVDRSTSAYRAGEKLQELGECNKCHFYGTTFPTQTADTWAPNLALVKERLRPEWVSEWLDDPQVIMKGTKMPAPSIPTAEDVQDPDVLEMVGEDVAAFIGERDVLINGLTDYLYTIPGKTDISQEVKDYFDKNNYNFLKVEEESDDWDDEGW